MERILKLPYIATIFLLVYMPFHIFLSQWLSTYTGYLDFWKIAKDLLLFAAIIVAVPLVYYKNGFKDRLFWIFFALSTAYLLLHILIWQINPSIADKPALLASAYNSRVVGFAVLGWATGIISKKYLDLKIIFRLVVFISAIVCVLGIIQYLLPKDFMTHFGYSLDRGVKPAFFIDDKPNLPRIISTLRDPNSLGAYLILPIALLVGAWLKKPKARMMLSGLLILQALTLFLTFSRSAWIGAVIAAAIVFFWHFKDKTKKIIKKNVPALAIGLVIILAGIFAVRNQYFVQNVIFHADESTKLTDSNQLHAQYAENGLKGIIHKPLGHGPGTAGLVSIQTKHVVLTEDYFIQIGYEVGIIGLVLLLAMMAYICRLLYLRGDFYSQVLIASFVGITFCCFLLHTWSNEAVACQWWLLAGLLVAGVKSRPVRD